MRLFCLVINGKRESLKREVGVGDDEKVQKPEGALVLSKVTPAFISARWR